MLELLEGIGRSGFWPFWVPVLVWTGLAAGALGALRRAHPFAGYRLRQALLLALPASLLAAPWLPAFTVPGWGGAAADILDIVPAGHLGGVAAPVHGVEFGTVPVSAPPVDIASALVGAATIAVLLLAIARLVALAGDLLRLRTLRLAAPPIADPAPRRTLRELTGKLGVRRPVALLEGPADSAPMTFGAWRPVILLPRALLDSPDPLRTALAHEVVHIRRGDYPWAVLDGLVAAAFSFHPLVRHLRLGIERCRETSCDAEVVALGLVRPTAYAALIAHAHTPAQFPIPAVAASLSAPSLTLKERLNTMKNFANRGLTTPRRAGIALAAAVVCVAVAVTAACMSRTEEEPPHPESARAVFWEGHAAIEADSLHVYLGSQTDSHLHADSLRYLESQRQATAEIARVREAAGVEAPGSEERRYTIPVMQGGEVSYYTTVTEEEVQLYLARLDLQMQYLRARLEEIRGRLTPPGDEHSFLMERYSLLRSMHTERVRAFETVMLEYETQEAMGDAGPRPATPGVFQ